MMNSTASGLPPALGRYQMKINFAAPTALNTDTVFSDADTGATFYQLNAPNIIRDAKHSVSDPAAGLVYTLFTRRQDMSKKRIGETGDFLTTFNGAIRPNMPFGINQGWIQFVEQQNLGALTAQAYLLLFQQPLAV